MAAENDNLPVNFDYFISGAHWRRDLEAIKQRIVEAEADEAIRLLDELAAQLA